MNTWNAGMTIATTVLNARPSSLEMAKVITDATATLPLHRPPCLQVNVANMLQPRSVPRTLLIHSTRQTFVSTMVDVLKVTKMAALVLLATLASDAMSLSMKMK